jgi:hypothetical protein
MSQSDFAIAVFFGALCAIAIKPVQPKIQEWVWPAGDGSRKGVRVSGRTDAEILQRFLEAGL